MKNRMRGRAIAMGFRVFGGAALLMAVAVSCAGSPVPDRSAGAPFGDVMGREWVLSELKGAAETVRINRQQMEADGQAGFFTIGFEDERCNGRAAPNLYNGPYTLASNQGISFGLMASTMMMALKEPDELNERDFFAFLGKVSRWDLRDGRLELFTVDADGNTVTLIFE